MAYQNLFNCKDENGRVSFTLLVNKVSSDRGGQLVRFGMFGLRKIVPKSTELELWFGSEVKIFGSIHVQFIRYLIKIETIFGSMFFFFS